MIAEIDFAFAVGRGEENPPAIIGHFHVIEMRPAARMDTDGSAQVHVGRLRTLRAHVRPPLEKLGLPVLERALQHFVAAEIDVVGNLVRVGNGHIEVFLDTIPVEFRFAASAEHFQSACFADGVGPDKNPVLPCRQAAKYARLQRLARTETQVRFHAGQGIRRQRAPFFERDANLVVPVERVGSGGDESQRLRILTLKWSTDDGPRFGEQLRIVIEARLDSRSPMHRRKQAEIRLGENQHGASGRGILVQHVNAIRRQREFQQRARKTAAALDQGE